MASVETDRLREQPKQHFKLESDSERCLQARQQHDITRGLKQLDEARIASAGLAGTVGTAHEETADIQDLLDKIGELAASLEREQLDMGMPQADEGYNTLQGALRSITCDRT